MVGFQSFTSHLPHCSQAPVEFVNRKSCEQNYTATKDTITASMMCAAGRSNGSITDSCQGDSGGAPEGSKVGRTEKQLWLLHGL